MLVYSTDINQYEDFWRVYTCQSLDSVNSNLKKSPLLYLIKRKITLQINHHEPYANNFKEEKSSNLPADLPTGDGLVCVNTYLNCVFITFYYDIH